MTGVRSKGVRVKSRGVTILVHKKTTFVLQGSVADLEGRYYY